MTYPIVVLVVAVVVVAVLVFFVIPTFTGLLRQFRSQNTAITQLLMSMAKGGC